MICSKQKHILLLKAIQYLLNRWLLLRQLSERGSFQKEGLAVHLFGLEDEFFPLWGILLFYVTDVKTVPIPDHWRMEDLSQLL